MENFKHIKKKKREAVVNNQLQQLPAHHQPAARAPHSLPHSNYLKHQVGYQIILFSNIFSLK